MRWLWRWLHMITLRRRQRGLGYLRITAGNNQTGVIGSTLPVALQVQATDSGGHPVPNLTIQWDFQGDGLTDATSLTNALGYATATAALGQLAGTQNIIASVQGQSLSVTFTATATLSTPVSIAANSVLSQSVTAGSAVTSPPSVFVADSGGNGYAGQAITWAVASGGGSIDTTGATTTDANGIATLARWTTGGSVGANTVTATASGLTGSPVTFLANGTAVVPTTLAINGGNNQTGVVAGTYGADLTVLVTGAGSVPVPGVTVSWAATSGGGLITVTSLTNASGIATGIPLTGTTAGVNTYTADIALGSGALAEVTFTITTVAGAASQVVLTTQPSPNCASGTAMPGQPIVAVQDVNSNTITSASGTMTATITAGDGSLTGDTVSIVNGVATYTALTITDANGGTDQLHFSNGTFGVDAAVATTVAPPVPDRILMVTQPSGGFAGSPLNIFAVRVADSSNVTIPGYTGQVQVVKATGTGTLGGTTTVNCVNGVATFTNVTYDTAEAGVSLLFSDPAGLLTTLTSATFTVSVATGTNEPAGMTPFLGSTGKVLVSGATQLTQVTIQFKDASTYTPAVTTLGVSLTAPGVPPTGDTNLAQINLPYHYTSGQGHGTIYCTPNLSSLGHKQIYMRCYAKVSDNWYGESTGVLKFFQPLTGTTSVQNRIIGSIHGAGTAALKWKVFFQFGTYTGGVINGVSVGAATSYYSPRAGTGDIVRGQWHLYEMWVQANTAGNADGSIKLWLDGQLTHAFLNNCRWDGTGFSWQNAQIQSVYGGPTVVNAVPDDQYIWVASPYYVSTHA